MNKNKSKLTYFGLIAFLAWIYIANNWFKGVPHLGETSSLFFLYDIFVIFLISSTLFFVGLYQNSLLPHKSKRDKFIGISMIVIIFGIFYSIFDQRIGNIFFVGIIFFLYSLFFIKHKKRK